MLYRIFVTKEDKVRKEWRTLHTEEFHNVYAYSAPRLLVAWQTKSKSSGLEVGRSKQETNT